MPRQPYLKIASHKATTELSIGPQAIGERPELETLVGRSLTLWPHIEAETALFLGLLIGTENTAALAVFQILRRSSAQRDAISEAANVRLDADGKELVAAILNAHKAIEAERNALAHGHLGTSSVLPDGLLWVNTADYIDMRMAFDGRPHPEWDESQRLKYLSSVWVYRADDLTRILADIREIGTIWYNALDYLRFAPGSIGRADKYRQLCDRPHIARELAKLRRENSLPIQPQ